MDKTSEPKQTKPRPAVYNSSLASGLKILEAFDGVTDLGLIELAARTGLEKSATQRFVATLVQIGYVERNPTTRRYALSPRLLTLGASYLRAEPLIERARPYLLNCNGTTGETVNLAVLRGTEIILVSRYPGIQMVRPNVVVGSAFPWHASSVGQAIVAFLPPPQLGPLLEVPEFRHFARHTLTSRDKLERRLDEIREQGFSLTVDEAYDGDISIAAPIFDQQGQPVAATSIAVLGSGWSPAQVRRKLAAPVIELANTISHSIPLTRKL